jgi:hypothetical protein
VVVTATVNSGIDITVAQLSYTATFTFADGSTVQLKSTSSTFLPPILKVYFPIASKTRVLQAVQFNKDFTLQLSSKDALKASIVQSQRSSVLLHPNERQAIEREKAIYYYVGIALGVLVLLFSYSLFIKGSPVSLVSLTVFQSLFFFMLNLPDFSDTHGSFMHGFSVCAFNWFSFPATSNLQFTQGNYFNFVTDSTLLRGGATALVLGLLSFLLAGIKFHFCKKMN